MHVLMTSKKMEMENLDKTLFNRILVITGNLNTVNGKLF